MKKYKLYILPIFFFINAFRIRRFRSFYILLLIVFILIFVKIISVFEYRVQFIRVFDLTQRLSNLERVYNRYLLSEETVRNDTQIFNFITNNKFIFPEKKKTLID